MPKKGNARDTVIQTQIDQPTTNTHMENYSQEVTDRMLDSDNGKRESLQLIAYHAVQLWSNCS
jgi:hypothetical protein